MLVDRWARELAEDHKCVIHRGFLTLDNERYATWVVNAYCQHCEERYFGAANNILSRLVQPIRLWNYVRKVRRASRERRANV